MSVELEDNFFATERGNTMLTNDGGEMVVWIGLDEGVWLEVSDTPDNYPRLNVSVIQKTEVELRQHVVSNLGGWMVVKWNLDEDPPTDGGDCVVGVEDDQ